VNGQSIDLAADDVNAIFGNENNLKIIYIVYLPRAAMLGVGLKMEGSLSSRSV